MLEEYPIRDSEDRVQQGPGRPVTERNEYVGENRSMSQYSAECFQNAVEKGNIRAFFQPLYRTITNKMLGAEALARWFDADDRMLSPADFIPELEENGLIYELDMEILRQTCAFYQKLVKRGTPLHTFSVNLSRLDFRHDDI